MKLLVISAINVCENRSLLVLSRISSTELSIARLVVSPANNGDVNTNEATRNLRDKVRSTMEETSSHLMLDQPAPHSTKHYR